MLKKLHLLVEALRHLNGITTSIAVVISSIVSLSSHLFISQEPIATMLVFVVFLVLTILIINLLRPLRSPQQDSAGASRAVHIDNSRNVKIEGLTTEGHAEGIVVDNKSDKVTIRDATIRK